MSSGPGWRWSPWFVGRGPTAGRCRPPVGCSHVCRGRDRGQRIAATGHHEPDQQPLRLPRRTIDQGPRTPRLGGWPGHPHPPAPSNRLGPRARPVGQRGAERRHRSLLAMGRRDGPGGRALNLLNSNQSLVVPSFQYLPLYLLLPLGTVYVARRGPTDGAPPTARLGAYSSTRRQCHRLVRDLGASAANALASGGAGGRCRARQGRAPDPARRGGHRQSGYLRTLRGPFLGDPGGFSRSGPD